MTLRRWRLKLVLAATMSLFVVTIFHFSPYTNESHPHPVTIPVYSHDSSLEDEWMKLRRIQLNLPDYDDPRRGCVMPKLTEYNPVYKSQGYRDKTIKKVVCKKEQDWLVVRNGNISWNPVTIKKYSQGVKCLINWMTRVNDFKQKKREPALIFDSRVNSTVILEDDFFYADCKTRSDIVLSPTYRWSNIMSGIRPKAAVMQRKNDNFLLKKEQSPFNILILGFDSVSHVNFMRRLPKLYHLLTQELDAVVLDNYNIIGDGTTAAILGMLAGSYEEELPETRRGKSSQTVDIYPLIFKDFKRNHYVTTYAEDESSIGTFQYRLNGFKDPPSDHYMRPFQLQAEADHKKHLTYCLGSKPKINILMSWLQEVLTSYPRDVGKFIFGFHSEYSHGVVEELNLADEPVTQWIRDLKDSSLLDNTILMVMSDHGHRFSFTRSTLQGKYEERLPFFSIIVPESLKRRFPKSYHALQINAMDRLTTPFDVYETLRSILYDVNRGVDIGVTAHDVKNMTRGLTLFREIPLERSCSDGKISDHWCACNMWSQVDADKEPLAMRAAEAIVSNINRLVKESGQQSQCQPLTLKHVTRSQKMLPKKDMIAFKESKDHDGRVPDLDEKATIPEVVYEIQVQTQPGNGLFEGTTKYTFSTDSFEVNVKEVSRVNRYGLTSKCVSDSFPHLAKFCYCRDQSLTARDAGYMGIIMG